MTTGIIVQARIGSSRIEKKMMQNLKGYPIIYWVYYRLLKVKKADLIVYALPDNSNNDELSSYLKGLGANIYRGNENNVLERYYGALRHFNINTMVRVCADNPLVSSYEVDRLISFFNKNECDYAFNHVPRNNNYPDGLGAEICSFNLIENMMHEPLNESHKEHIFNFIWDKQSRYKIRTFDSGYSLEAEKIKLDIDTIDDLCHLESLPISLDISPVEIINLFK